jgi:hypothetical protein
LRIVVPTLRLRSGQALSQSTAKDGAASFVVVQPFAGKSVRIFAS